MKNRVEFRGTLAIGAAAVALVLAASAVATTLPPAQEVAAAPVYEIRSYHFVPDRLDDYRAWANTHALTYLREHLDVVGFWVGAGIEAEVSGAPLDELGSANVTWVIRWESKAVRDAQIQQVFSTPEWAEIFARLPGGGSGYLRIESRFFEAL